jgi:hypothetical protein
MSHAIRDTDIGLGDLIASVERLGAREDAVVRRIGELLQVEDIVDVAHKPAAPLNPIPREAGPEPKPKAKLPAEPVREAMIDFRRSRVSRSRNDAPAFVAPIPVLPPATDEAKEPPPPFEPLFMPSWTRAILSIALGTPSEHGAIDLNRVVERVSRGRALTRLPRRIVPTLRKGVQVLVDRGSGMVPFARDAEALVREIILVAGHETPVLHFRGLPTGGVANLKRHLQLAYEVPPAGVPVALITDFGIGVDPFDTDRPTSREWIEFLRSVRRKDSPLLAFVPYPRQRCARSIASLVTIIEWDRRTSLTRIRAQLRRGWSGR